MARWNTVLGYTLLSLTGMILSGNSVFAESSEKQIYQVAQNVPGLDTMDQGKGTLGGEERRPVVENSAEGKKRFEKAKGIKAKEVLSTSGELGDDARSLVPYTKFFSAGYVGEEMDPVGGVLGNRASRSYGGMISHDAMTVTDFLYIDIGQEDDVQVGDRFIVYSQYYDVRHPLQTFSITFEREIDLLDNEYQGQYAHDAFSARTDVVGSQILVKGVITVVETASITSKAVVDQAFNPIQVDDLIVPYPERRPPMVTINYVPPKKDIQGYIIGNRGNNLMFTMNEVVFLDQGEEDGVDVGDRFEIYAYPLTIDEDEDDINPDIIGEITVISIQEDTSTGVILNVTEPIIPGHKIRSKR
ncbi:MAG: hypothetical protein OEM27_00780 [Nitrospinota bacterium]|nr:hypothetical protein [Nitrospinota bacterium]